MLFRLAAALVASTALPFLAAAQTTPCAPSTNDQGRLDCDVSRASQIATNGEQLFGPAPDAWVRIVDTVSPSGASYVYYVIEEGPYQLLEARSVPRADANGNAPACQLRTALPLDVAEKVKSGAAALAENPPKAYGPREAVTHNPDGSRSIRLIVDSHEIITRITSADGSLDFSRLEAVEDAITNFNNLVIGVANFSGDWSCGAV